MDKIEWIAPCHFGLESVLKREVEQLGTEESWKTGTDCPGRRRQGYFSRRRGGCLQGKHIFADCGACIDESRQFSGKDI